MAQPVEGAGEFRAVAADRGEAGARIPGAGGAGADVETENIVAAQVAVDPLQVGAGDAGLIGSQLLDHGIGRAVQHQLQRAAAAGQVELAAGAVIEGDIVGRRAQRDQGVLADGQRTDRAAGEVERTAGARAHVPHHDVARDADAGVADGGGIEYGRQHAARPVGSVSPQSVAGAARPARGGTMVGGRSVDVAADGAAVVIADQQVDVAACAAGVARGVTVGYRAVIVVSHQSTDVVSAAHAAGGVAVADSGGKAVIPHQPADVVASAADAARGVAVDDSTEAAVVKTL